MSQIKENLKKILNIKDLENRLKLLEDKAVIEGAVGIARQDPAAGDGNGDGSSGGGSTSGGVTGNGDTTASEAQITDADDVFDNPKIGQRLDQITGAYDCETGDELELSPNGLFKAPEGWLNADDPPSSLFELGYRWSWNGGGTYFSTPVAAYEDQYLNQLGGGGEAPPGSGNIYAKVNGPHDRTYDAGSNTFTYITTFVQITSGGVPIPPGSQNQFDAQIAGYPCTAGVDANCPTTDPGSGETWPEGRPTQLAWKDGRWQSNSNQTDVPEKYQDNSQSTMDFCFDDSETGDTRHGRFVPAKDGGLLLYETDEAGDAIGSGQHYDENGILTYMVNNDDIAKFTDE